MRGTLILLGASFIFLTVGLACLARPYQIRNLVLKAYSRERFLTKVTPFVDLLKTRFVIWELRVIGVVFILACVVLLYILIRVLIDR